MLQKLLAELDYVRIAEHYEARAEVGRRLTALLKSAEADEFAQLALGMDDVHGNYSARDHNLGPRILAARSPQTVLSLAADLQTASSDQQVHARIYAANIPFLKISVGTEIAMLLQPGTHWVANVRSIWCHLVVKHRSLRKANEELKLYRLGIDESEMPYKLWCGLHTSMRADMEELARLSSKASLAQGVTPGSHAYLWADAISNQLYEEQRAG